MTDERRVPVQGDGMWWLSRSDPRRAEAHEPGTITWEEHLEAWADYDHKFPGQPAEDVARRGGFSYLELVGHLGHEPKTWRPR